MLIQVCICSLVKGALYCRKLLSYYVSQSDNRTYNTAPLKTVKSIIKLGMIFQIVNEQTCSLQLSDSVYLWASLVRQAIHKTFVRKTARKPLLTKIFWTTGQLDFRTLGQTQDRLSRIWRRAGYSPSQIIKKMDHEMSNDLSLCK